MKLWKRLWGRKNPAEARPEPSAATLPEKHPVPVVPEATRPVSEAMPTSAASVPRSPLSGVPPGWLGPSELAAIGSTRDEKVLVRRILEMIPGASSEDALFRFHLSQAFILGEYPLPILPATALRVLDLAHKSNVSLYDYARLVEADPGLAKSVLNRANTAIYASAGECTSLGQAMSLVGMQELERIAFMHAFGSQVFRVRGHNELVESVSRHGLAAALGSQQLAFLTGVSQTDSFLAGLFHDCGKLVILNVVSEAQRKLKRIAPVTLIESACNTFHVVVGEDACRRWGLMPSIIRALTNHHSQLASEDVLDTTVYLGNQVAHAAELPEPVIALPADDPVLVASKLTQADLQLAAAKTRVELTQYALIMKWR